MTKKELVRLLRKLQKEQAKVDDVPDVGRVIQELEFHQIDLELQNGALREAQLQLQLSAGRYGELYDQAPIAYLTLDPDGRIREANLTAASLLGIERSRLLGRSLAAVANADQRQQFREHLRRCVVDQARVATEVTLAPAGVPVVTVQMISTPIVDPDGATRGCKTTMTDVTALKRTQQRLSLLTHAGAVLASSFDYRSTLAEVVSLCVPLIADLCVVDLCEPDGRLRRIEIAAADAHCQAIVRTVRGLLYPIQPHSAVATTLARREAILFEDCTPASLAAGAGGMSHETLVKAMQARSLLYVPMLARDQSQGVLTLAMTTSGRRFAAADLATAEDLAVRAALAIEGARHYEDAERASQGRQDLLAFVSHDLKNPLTGILLTAEMMLAAVPARAERGKTWRQLDRIRRGAVQMRRMIEDLLDVASIEAGRLSMQTKDNDVKVLCEDALELLQPMAAEKRIRLECALPAQTIRVACDRDRTLQVFSNVLGNAIKFTPAGGRIVVTVRASAASALFEIKDSGPGVAAPQLRRLFERFWQADETARKGRGLGLFIAKAIVEGQRGTIWAESQPGSGATFSFTIPLATEQLGRVGKAPAMAEPRL